MAFNPNLPFEEEAIAFDPTQPFEVEEEAPRPIGTSFSQEVGQLGPAFIESIGRPLENMGEGFEVVGFQGVANALKGAITEPENYVSAAERFMEPQPGESQFLGFAWQYAPRAAVEQTGQALAAIGGRIAGAVAGGVVAGPPGAIAGGFVGPAIIGAAQVIGPVAKERARNNGREVPNNQDLAAATLTAIGSGALDAIGARYLPGGDKATGKFFKRVASSFVGEGLLTEAPQSIVEQVGSTAGTEAGLNINVKQAIGEGLIGGTTAAGLQAITYPLTKEPKNQVIRTPEQAEEIDIQAKSNEEAVSLMGQPADQDKNELISRVNEIEKVVANNETLINSLEPNDETRTQLELENKIAKQEAGRLRGELEKSVGLAPIPTAEQQQVELAKQIAAPVEPAPAEAPAVTPAPPVTEAPAVTPVPVAETPAVAPAPEVAPAPTEYKGKVKREYESGLKAGETAMVKPTGVSQEAVSAMELDDMRKDVRAAKDKSAGNAMVRAYRHGKTQGRVNRNAPVFTEAVEAYGITLPEGYTKQGDLYVYQPAVSETITPAVEAAPVTPAPAEAPAITPAEKTYVQLENEAIDIQNKINEEEGVSALIGVSDNAITLSGLESREKGKGTRALEIITQEADKNNTPISLKAESKTGETQRLKEFYMRFGFVNDPSFSPESNRMIRYPNATPAITPATVERPTAETVPSRNWELYSEELFGDLEAFSPARTTGRTDYDLMDVATRFVEFAKKDTSGKPLSKLVSDFGKADLYATTSQIKKLRTSVKSIEQAEAAATPATATPPPAAEAPAPEVAPAKKIIAYRGDKAGIQEFEMKEGEGVEGDFGKGPYLSSSKRIATSYADGADEAFAGLEVPKGREVYTTEVDIKKPLWVWYGGVTESSRMPEFFASKEFQALAERVRATKDESAIFNLERAIKENGFRNYKGATFALANPFGGWEKAKTVFKEVGFDGIAAQLGSDGDPSIQYVPFAKEQVKIVKEQPQVAPAAPAEAVPVGISIGSRIKLGKSPQTYTIEEVLPQSEAERGLGEQFYSVKNERTGEVQTVESKDLKPVLARVRRGEKGGVLFLTREDFIQAGQNIYEAGMEFATWARQMVQRFGDAVRQFLGDIWQAVSGMPAKVNELAGFLPGKGEAGAVAFGRGEEPPKPPKKPAEPAAEAKPTGPAPESPEGQSVPQAISNGIDIGPENNMPINRKIDSHLKNFLFLRGFFESGSDRLRRVGFAKLGNAIDAFFDGARRRLGDANKIMLAPLEAYEAAPSARKKKIEEDFQTFFAAQENKRDTESIRKEMDPIARRIVDAWQKFGEESGKENQRVGVKVFDPNTQSWRKIGRVEKFWPRRLKPEYQRALYEPDKYAKEYNEIVEALLEDKKISKREDAEKYLREYSPEATKNDYFSGIEKARGKPLPEKLYDYSMPVMTDYIARWAQHVSRIEQFGQKTSEQSQTLWDREMATTRDPRTKDYIQAARERVEGYFPNDPFLKGTSALNIWATGLQLGNPASAILNLIGGSTLNAMVGQPGALGSYVSSLSELRNLGQQIRDAKEKGILGRDLMNIVGDHQAILETNKVAQAGQKTADFLLKWSGFTPVEQMIRTQSLIIGKSFVRNTLNAFSENPNSSFAKRASAWITRNGFDLDKLIVENGTGPETDRVLRYFANISQGSYTIDQVPIFIDMPIGRFLFKYQKFSTQVMRMSWKNTFEPLFKAMTGKGEQVQIPDKTRQFIYQMLQAQAKELGDNRPIKMATIPKTTTKGQARALTLLPAMMWLGSAYVGGEVLLRMRDILFGVLMKGPEYEDMLKELEDDDKAGAMYLALERAWYNLIGIGALGLIGNYAQFFLDWQDRERVKNPLEPPSLGILKDTAQLVTTVVDQGTLTGGDIENFIRSTLSAYRTTQKLAQSTAGFLGLEDIPGVKEEMFRREVANINKYARRWAEEAGIEYRMRRPTEITASPRTPVNRKIASYLQTGNPQAAVAYAKAYLNTLPKADRLNAIQSISAGARSRQPLRLGTGPMDEVERRAFLKWLQGKVNEERYKEIAGLDKQYQRDYEKFLRLLPNR